MSLMNYEFRPEVTEQRKEKIFKYWKTKIISKLLPSQYNVD